VEQWTSVAAAAVLAKIPVGLKTRKAMMNGVLSQPQ